MREFEVFKREMLLAPHQVRVRLLERIEEFLAGLDTSKTYPFDFVFFSITGHRPESPQWPVLCADEISLALARLLDEVGRTIRVRADSIDEDVLTVGELAGRWNVSPATVLRWRRDGLASRFFNFGTGRRKVGVRLSLVRRFETDRARLIRRARSRRGISAGERRALLEEALVSLAREVPPGKILAGLAERFVLRQSKVQRLLGEAARANPALLPLTRANISRRERDLIFAQLGGGAPAEEVARRWGRSVESVRKIYLRGRARNLLRRPVKFIDSREFHQPGASAFILDCDTLPAGPSDGTAAADELPVYLKGIAGAPLLGRDEEAALFRKYNYLKFLAARHLGKLDSRRPSVSLMDRIESLLAQAQRVRERLVRSNLRLVVSIAKRHHGRRTEFAALVSDGNIALLDAVEAFDYSRGNRFSTYAGWAIIRRFARTVPEDNYRLVNVGEEVLEKSAEVEFDYTAPAPDVIESGIARALGGLSDRERVVIESRFGFGGRRKPATLQEIGKRFGLTKERIRQIEAQALRHLRAIVETAAPELVPA